MADRTGLTILGWAFGGVTFAVMLIAAFVVTANLDGSSTRDNYTAFGTGAALSDRALTR